MLYNNINSIGFQMRCEDARETDRETQRENEEKEAHSVVEIVAWRLERSIAYGERSAQLKTLVRFALDERTLAQIHIFRLV